MRKAYILEWVIQNIRMVLPKVLEKRPNPYAIRLSQKEKELLETLRFRWQLPTKAKVIHQLIKIADSLESKYKEAIEKLEAEKNRREWS